jgi:hypothetical protein
VKLTRRFRSVLAREPEDEADDEPCIPCGQQRGVRQFSLNPAPPRVIDDGMRPRLSPGRQFAVVDGQVVLYDPVAIVSHVLNPSAAAVWAAVDGHREVAEIIDVLEADTGVERSVLDPDVRRTLARFVDSHVVTFAPEPEPTPTVPARITRWPDVVERILDRVEWVTTIGPVRASGLDVVVRSNLPELAGPLAEALDALPRSPRRDGAVVVSVHDGGGHRSRRYRLYVGGRLRWVGAEPTGLVDQAVREITQEAEADARGRLLLHAGAVERDGVVVAICGRSGGGKSTLTAALVQRGFAYVTDELLSVDSATLDVWTYPKAIDLDAGSCRLLGIEARRSRPAGPRGERRRDRVPVGDLGAPSGGGRLGLVVFLDDDVAEVGGSTSAGVRSVLDLIGVTFGSTFADDLALEMLVDVASTVPCIRIGRGPIDAMGQQVESGLIRTP